MSDPFDALRRLPSVDRVLSEAALADALTRLPRKFSAAAVRDELALARVELRAGRRVDTSPEAVAARAARAVAAQFGRSLRPVVNATGVVIHTNLGRAPLSNAAIRAMSEAAQEYSNLEFDLDAGLRGSRANHLESLLSAVTGAETGLVVNNNAAALVLALSEHASGREAIVSRGQAVEIGGGFRIPDVIRQSGAQLVEVGTTNRTRAEDFRSALNAETAALLRVHSSNFRVIGFVKETLISEMREVADGYAGRSPLVIDDVGSGCLLDTRAYGLAYEPRPQDSIADGADLVLFSGDKLLGGPQAGIIAGSEEAIAPLRRAPLLRALRADKTTIAALAATLEHYLAGEAEREIPIWKMISADPASLRRRAGAWRASAGAGEVRESKSAIGGGSLPGETMPTWIWSIQCAHPSAFAAALRDSQPPVIARVVDDKVQLDPRTVFPEQDSVTIEAVRAALNGVA